MNVRAKFYVTNITSYASPAGTGNVSLTPVFQSKPGVEGNACEENHIFGKYTPGGSINLSIQNPEAFKRFELGRAYYVDFTPAEEFIPQS